MSILHNCDNIIGVNRQHTILAIKLTWQNFIVSQLELANLSRDIGNRHRAHGVFDDYKIGDVIKGNFLLMATNKADLLVILLQVLSVPRVKECLPIHVFQPICPWSGYFDNFIRVFPCRIKLSHIWFLCR